MSQKIMLYYLYEYFSGTPWLGGTVTIAKSMSKSMDSWMTEMREDCDNIFNLRFLKFTISRLGEISPNLISYLFHIRYSFRPCVFLFIDRDEYLNMFSGFEKALSIFLFFSFVGGVRCYWVECCFEALVSVGVARKKYEVTIWKYNFPCTIQNCKSCSYSLLKLCLYMLHLDEFYKKFIILYFCPYISHPVSKLLRLTVYSLLPSGTTTISKPRVEA